MNCMHPDPEVRAEARSRKLRGIIGGLTAPVPVQPWYCVWCKNHYQGEKYCLICSSGIYSIEETTWQANYT